MALNVANVTSLAATKRALHRQVSLLKQHWSDGQWLLVHLSVRSEEHTSELQSRPHISYAVFCLKKKKNNKKKKEKRKEKKPDQLQHIT